MRETIKKWAKLIGGGIVFVLLAVLSIWGGVWRNRYYKKAAEFDYLKFDIDRAKLNSNEKQRREKEKQIKKKIHRLNNNIKKGRGEHIKRFAEIEKKRLNMTPKDFRRWLAELLRGQMGGKR